MRPLRLEFRAFGSYPGHHTIDFDALGRRGLFLVTGPTGSGKTTLFDAMAYALYGSLPGARSSTGEPRSHYAAPDVETFVELDFEADLTRYRVRRTPKYERPARRGDGTVTQRATAALVKVVDGGTESLAAQPDRVDSECQRIVGLDFKQFQRVVLLPQGRFTDFLVAPEGHREELLKQLFGGELYETATQLLRDRLFELQAEVTDADNEIKHHRDNAITHLRTTAAAWAPDLAPADDASDAAPDETLAALQRLRDVEAAKENAAGATARAAAERATQARNDATRFDKAGELRRQLVGMEGERQAVDDGEAVAQSSRLARPAVTAAAAVEDRQRELSQTAEVRDRLLGQIMRGFEAMGIAAPGAEPAAIAAAVASREAEVRESRARLEAAARANEATQTARTALESAEAARAAAEEAAAAARAESEQLSKELDVLRPVAARLDGCAAAVEAATAALTAAAALQEALAELPTRNAANAAARDEALRVMQRFIDTQAPRLAAALVDGEPCAVCGSTVHPAKATGTGGDLVDHAAVEAARQDVDRAAERRAELQRDIDRLRGALGADVDAPLDELRARIVAAQAELTTAREAAEGVAGREPLSIAAAARSRTLAERAGAAAVQLAGARAAADNAAAAERELAGACAAIDRALLERQESELRALAPAVADLPVACTTCTGATAGLDAARAHADGALAASGFADLTAARRAVVDPDREAALLRHAAEWRDRRRESQAQLDLLVAEGVPAERPDVAALDEQAASARTNAEAAVRRFTAADGALTAAAESLATARAVGADSQALRARRDDLRVVFATCNGEAGIKVKLERWVLASELERVTNAANVHLGRMSNHRYRLGRKGGRNALELEVLDAHTGRPRATGSLSGGEQFQASLSLALGLADVVSHGGTASGKQFEALFVDEGFGSLDPKALDDAIEALARIQATGRMVGAITHVEGMKQRLHTGIEVSPNPDGRGSTLTVNP